LIEAVVPRLAYFDESHSKPELVSGVSRPIRGKGSGGLGFTRATDFIPEQWYRKGNSEKQKIRFADARRRSGLKTDGMP
jgi:hypothetical protein